MLQSKVNNTEKAGNSMYLDHRIDFASTKARENSKKKSMARNITNLQGKNQNNKSKSNDLNSMAKKENLSKNKKMPNKKTTNSKETSKQRFNQNSKTKTIRQTRTRKVVKKPSIKVAFLGGLNEIGKNVTLFECNDDMFILDCGMAFPDVEMPGVDLVIPDFSYIEKNFDRIKGLVITHGHEDHIGSIPYLLKSVNVPIYGTPLTIGLLNGKLKEHNLLNKAKLNVVKAGDKIRLGCMEIEFVHVNHSIPDAVGVAIHSPAGTLVHTGDFKIDFTPVHGKVIDLGKFADLGNKGVLALFADSTNADRPGYTKTEKSLTASFDALFRKAENKRIIIASFASNIGRIKQIIECAVKYNRKVAFSGRSMINYVTIASELGYMNVPEGVIIDIDLLTKYPKEQVVLLTTGSQGEPMSALSRMASADHKKVEVGPEDFIIISANPIPGNEKMIGSVINDLMKRGCTVVYEAMHEVHVSGHACAEELKLIQSLVKPKYFIPVHGEQKHLRRHGELAKEMGMKESNVYIGDIGDLVEINENYIKNLGKVPAGKVLVDGLGVGDVGSVVLRDRKKLAEDGLIIVVCTMDFSNGYIVSGPDIVSRGFVYVRESEDLMAKAKKLIIGILEECNTENIREWSFIKIKIKDKLSKLFYEQTKRSPMILPIIMEV